jgi:hypothetical protein
MKTVEEKIIAEGLSNAEQLLLGYRKALVSAFLIGEQLKKSYDMVPPKFQWKYMSGEGDTEFFGRLGLEVSGDWIKHNPKQK